MEELEGVLTSVDWSTPEGWRSALTAYGNALIAACERGASLKARFAQLAASGDPDAFCAGLKEILGELPDLVTLGEHLEERYAEWREYIGMAESTRKPPEG